MTEHLTEREVELYQRRAIDPARRLSLSAHLNACEDCLRRVLDPEYSSLAFTALTEAFLPPVDEEPFHLSREELKKYLSGRTDEADRIVCESHLEICAECKEEALALSTAGLGPRESGALPLNEGATLKERFSSLWQWPMRLRPARVAVLIVCLGSLVLLGLIGYQALRVRPGVEVAQTEPEKKENPSPATAENGATATRPPEDTLALPPNAGDRQRESRPDDSATSDSDMPDSSSPALSLRDSGREIKLSRDGNLIGLDGLDAAAQRAVKTVLTDGSLPVPQSLNELSAPGINLMGQATGEPALKLASPLGRVISDDRPVLRWHRLSGETSYTVSLFDSDFNRVAVSAPQQATEWRVPVKLARGRIYSWEVTARKDGREITAPVAPVPRAQFKVVEAERLSELSSLKRRPTSHLALGVMYARAGLLVEAEQEFQKLLKDNPRSSLARKLLRTVQAWQKR
jgi:anti-sigma factor RsiW